jgi:hypothetical protein
MIDSKEKRLFMTMATGAGFTGATPSLQRGKSKGGLTPFSMQQFTPAQMNLFSTMFSHLDPSSYLSKLASGDQSMFEELEAPALKQFGQLQGQLASRFSGFGSGARHSSGFRNTMNQATSDFAQQLQSQRLGLRRQALTDLLGMGNQLLGQRPYDQFVSEKKPSFLKQMLAGLAGPGLQGALTGGTMGYMSRPSGGGQSAVNNAMFDLFPLIL